MSKDVNTSTHTPFNRVLGLTLLATIALGARPAPADEIYVVDFSYGAGAGGALFRVNAANGGRSLVSDFNNAQGPLGIDPFGLAVEAGGTVLVIDDDAGMGGRGALFRVNAVSGNRSLVSDFGNAAQGPLGANPSGVALEAGGTVLVIDPDAGIVGRGALFRVDAASGNRSLVSDFGTHPRALALEAGGAVLVIAGSELLRVDAVSGIHSLVSDFGNAAQGPLGRRPIGVAVEAGGTVLVIDRDAKIDPDTPTFGRGALFRVDAASGNRSLVSDFGDEFQGTLGDAPHGVAVEARGTVLVIDRDAALTTAGQSQSRSGVLFRVDRLSGLRTVVNDFTSPPRGRDPVGVAVGIAVVVPNCYGRVPTLVGDNGNNVLIGSARADVILGRAGDDVIYGRGGNDRICGGTGNDRLGGGAGFDRIDGGKGTDRCKSGEVKVRCER